ncbi:MAG: hypothetical protein ACTS6P_01525 [Candidatus Hodgkinia cicadicola]
MTLAPSQVRGTFINLTSKRPPSCPFGGLDASAIIFGILLHWAPPQMLALPAPQVPAS